MSSLDIVRSSGPIDRVASAFAAVRPSTGDTRFRLAYHPDDLPRAHWRDVKSWCTAELVPVLLAASQTPSAARVYAEIENGAGTSVIDAAGISAGGALSLAAPVLNPESGYYIRARGDVGPVCWPIHHYNDGPPGVLGAAKYPPGNNFIPLLWHADGYSLISDATWEIDIGETPDVILAARIDTAQFGVNFFDISQSNKIIYAEVADPDLDLKGGQLEFAVVCTFADGKRGRYHLKRALTVGPSFALSQWYVPSGSNSDWSISFAADNVPWASMPSGPDISRITEIDIAIVGFSDPPTGELRIKEMGVKAA